ncbi:hypothetical protein ACFL3R_00760 [Thermodesulfobacteriota bacterium]
MKFKLLGEKILNYLQSFQMFWSNSLNSQSDLTAMACHFNDDHGTGTVKKSVVPLQPILPQLILPELTARSEEGRADGNANRWKYSGFFRSGCQNQANSTTHVV